MATVNDPGVLVNDTGTTVDGGTPPPPPPPRSTRLFTPRIMVEIGFFSTPNLRPLIGAGDWFTLDDDTLGVLDTSTLGPDQVWVDVTGRLRNQVTIRRGRNRDLDEFSAGTATFELINGDQRFDPLNADSPYAGNIEPMRPVRIFLELPDGWRTLIFQGFAVDWHTDYAYNDSTVNVTCRDAFTILAAVDLPEIADLYAGDLPGQRIERVLDQVGFTPARDIDDGISVLGPTSWGGSALAHMQAVATSDVGSLFVARDGLLTFRQRTSGINTAPAVTFVNGPTGGTLVHSYERDASYDLLFNRIVTSGISGTEFTANDPASQERFLVRNLNLTGLLIADNNVVESIGEDALLRYAYPQQRVSAVTVKLHDPHVAGDLETLAQLDIGTTASVSLTIGTVPIEQDATIEGVEWHASTEGVLVTYRISTADTRAFLMLDSTKRGMLDANRLAL